MNNSAALIFKQNKNEKLGLKPSDSRFEELLVSDSSPNSSNISINHLRKEIPYKSLGQIK